MKITWLFIIRRDNILLFFPSYLLFSWKPKSIHKQFVRPFLLALFKMSKSAFWSIGGAYCRNCFLNSLSNVDGGTNGSSGGVVDQSIPAGKGSGVDISQFIFSHWKLTPGNGGQSIVHQNLPGNYFLMLDFRGCAAM